MNIMDAVIYSKLILMLLSSNILDINNATLWNFQMEFPCAKFYKKGELNVDCSSKHLNYIPDIPPNTVYLNLYNNFITQILNNTFEHMINLKVLDLSFNELQSMNVQTFNGLGNLKHLKLNNNKLTGGMPNKTFGYMTCLTHLDLSFNTLERINLQTCVGLQNLQNLQLNNNKLDYNISSFPTGSFKSLESLTRLSIYHNNFLGHRLYDYSIAFPDKTISEILELDIHSGSSDGKVIFGKGFSSLKNLYLLNVSNCNDFILKNDTFKFTPNLTHVYINYCSLSVYGTGHEVFSKLMKLKILQLNPASDQLSRLMISEDELLALITGLSKTTIEILKMSYILDIFNLDYFSDIINKISDSLNKAPIQELHFTKYFKLQVPQTDKPVQVPPTLRTLDLSNNILEVLKLNIRQVTSLNLEDNRLGNYLAKK